MSYKWKEEAESDTCEEGREGKKGWEGRVSLSITAIRKICKAHGESLGAQADTLIHRSPITLTRWWGTCGFIKNTVVGPGEQHLGPGS